ncbi:peroxiredoxin family protein [Acidobacteriota bacterium]
MGRFYAYALRFGVFILILFLESSVYGKKKLAEGMELPEIELSTQGSSEIQEYLALESAGSFCLTQLPAKIVLIELFGVYCPVCIKQAPLMNQLYKFIQENSDLTDGVKMIAIAPGNKDKELKVYKTRFKVPFPLFPDADKRIYTKLGKPPIPVVIVVDSTGKVLLTHTGKIKDIEEFFSTIKKLHEKI